MSIVKNAQIANNDQSDNVNITIFKAKIEEKRQALIPIVSFYETLREGWENRVGVAETALHNIKNISPQDLDKINELIKIAQLEIQRIDNTFRETSIISDALWVKIQDLDMLSLRQSSAVPGVNVQIDIEAINRVFHQADALIALRQGRIKELTS